MTIAEALQIALNHHRADQLDQAENLYRQVLAVDPNQPDALHFLGVVCRQKGAFPQALELIQRSLVIRPDEVNPLINLAQTHKEMGQLQQALEIYSKITEINPPNVADIFNNMGNIHKTLGQGAQAIEAYQKAISLNPHFALAWYNLGISLQDKSLHQEAIEAYQKALSVDPSLSLAHANLAHSFNTLGQFDNALKFALLAFQNEPDNPQVLSTLGNVRRDLNQIPQAIELYQKALKINPNQPNTLNNLGHCFNLIGQIDEALHCFKTAIRLKPDITDLVNNLGNAYKNQGLLDLAIECYRKSMVMNPLFHPYHDNLIMMMHYSIHHSAADIFSEQRLWNSRYALPRSSAPPQVNPDPHRKLRVGFVSPDFREHPIARFIPPLFAHLDPEQFEIFAYNDLLKSDSITDAIHALVPHWRETYTLNAENFVQLVKNDQIDILVDLASHSGGNRLPAFAQRPAPIQVSWLAYCGSTGIDAMDYRISDPLMDPPGMFDKYYSEKTVLLPDCYWCYSAPPSAPEPAFPESADPVFGCFNNFCKVNDVVLSLWARILTKIPNATFLLYSQEGTHRNITFEKFHNLGVDHSRIRFVRHLSPASYYALHHQVHLILDPFPFNGGTTTCDALWMGVPVVSRVSTDRAVGRAGLSILSQVGLSDLATDSADAYVQTAVQLAQNTPRLRDLRNTLRQTMQSSPLMDAPRFAKNFGDLLRTIWKNHNSGNQSK